MTAPRTKLISAVIPIFNEEDTLPQLLRRLNAALDSTGHAWEAIFVNDGSRDASLQILRDACATDPRLRIVSLSRNFGHQPAVTAGVHQARGDAVVLIDGDLQDPPEVIPDLVRKWEQGFQVVIAERRTRDDAGARSLGFKLFYPLMRRVSDLPHTPDAGIFGLMDRVVVDEFNRLPERSRFIPGLRSWLGFSQSSVLYDRQPRAAGEPKQTFPRLLRYAFDGMISFSYKPLRVATASGFLVSGLSFVLALYYLGEFLYRGGRTYGSGFTTLILCVLFLGGIQLITIGILGEYVGRIYEEIKQRPLYIVQEKIGFEATRAAPPEAEKTELSV